MPDILASALVSLALIGCARQGLVADDPYERPVSRLLREATGIVASGIASGSGWFTSRRR